MQRICQQEHLRKALDLALQRTQLAFKKAATEIEIKVRFQEGDKET